MILFFCQAGDCISYEAAFVPFVSLFVCFEQRYSVSLWETTVQCHAIHQTLLLLLLPLLPLLLLIKTQ